MDKLLASGNSVGVPMSEIVIACEPILDPEQACKFLKPVILKNRFSLLLPGKKGRKRLDFRVGLDKGAKQSRSALQPLMVCGRHPFEIVRVGGIFIHELARMKMVINDQ